MTFDSKFDTPAAIQRAIKLRKDGLSPIAIIKAVRAEFGIGLRDAKLILNYSMSEEQQKAHAQFVDDLCAALEVMESNGESEN